MDEELTLDLALCVLTWRAPRTLEQTLQSYERSGLLALARERWLFVQELAPESPEHALAARFGFSVTGDAANVGIGPAFLALARSAGTDLVIFLEDDWVCVEPPARVRGLLDDAASFIHSGEANAVRLRSRQQPGEPLYSRCTEGREGMFDGTHLLDAVHWRSDPEVLFPEKIRLLRSAPAWYVAPSRYANYTNNPCLYKRVFFLEHLARFCGDGGVALEAQATPWWREQNFRVAQGDGLFTHQRVDHDAYDRDAAFYGRGTGSDGPPADGEPFRRNAAAVYFQEGVKAYEGGNRAAALTLFCDAFETFPFYAAFKNAALLHLQAAQQHEAGHPGYLKACLLLERAAACPDAEPALKDLLLHVRDAVARGGLLRQG